VNSVLQNAKRLLFDGRYDELIVMIDQRPELVYERDEYGKTLLLICAGRAGTSSVLQELIRLGADPNQRDYDNSNALAAAICSGSRYGLTTENEIRTLIKGGANPNAIADCGMPALHWAISQHRPDYVSLLLNCGADPSHRTDDVPAESAMEVALRVGATESLEILQTSNTYRNKLGWIKGAGKP
jgi:ankyrin repeat protein